MIFLGFLHVQSFNRLCLLILKHSFLFIYINKVSICLFVTLLTPGENIDLYNYLSVMITVGVAEAFSREGLFFLVPGRD